MYKAAIILLLCSFGLNKAEETRYEKVFSTDFSTAINYLNTHSKQFTQSATKYDNQAQLLSTIVFPELMRYSGLKDVMETSALELMYVKGGAAAADFSIGRFQMKPSFAEGIEQELVSKDLYKQLKYSHKNTIEQTRKERIARLQNLEWQLVYLNGFVSICKQQFKDQKFEIINDSLSFYASAYNTGFTKPAEEIKANVVKCYFPYGTKYKGKQYSYANVACYFNNYAFSKSKSSLTLK